MKTMKTLTKLIYPAILLLAFAFTGCGDEDEGDGGISTAEMQVTVTASAHGGPAPLNLSFWAAVTGNNGAVTYLWTFGDGATSAEAAPSHSFPQAGIFNVSLLVTDSRGSTAANGLTITVQAEPQVVVTADPELGTEPLTVAFTCTNDAWTGGLSYFWEFGDGRTSTQQDPTHTYVDAGTYLASCTTASGGAEATGSAVIEVVADGVPTVAITAAPQQGIAPLAVHFSSVATGGDGAMTYSWNFGDGSPTDASGAPGHTFLDPGVYLVMCTATDADGDTGSDVIEIAVGTDEQPAVLALAEPDRGPAPLDVAFSCPVEGGNPPFSFEWDMGVPGTVPVTSPFQDIDYTYEQVGNYTATCTVTDVDGDVRADSVEITVDEPNLPPVVDAWIVDGACAVPGDGEMPGTTVILDAGATDDDPLSYEWVFERVPPLSRVQFNNPTVANASFVPDRTGTYELRVYVSDGLHRVASDLLTVVASNEPAFVVPIGYEGLTGVAVSYIEQPLTVQVLNDCGGGQSVPIPYTFVRWYGRNAFPSSPYTYTDAGGYTSNHGNFGYYADMESAMVAVAGCVAAEFQLHVDPAEAYYLVMQNVDPTPVTPDVDDALGVEIHLQLTDQFLNPVSGPQTVFDLDLWSESCMLVDLAAEEIAGPPRCPFFDSNGSYYLWNQVTDANGHFTTRVSHYAATDVYVEIDTAEYWYDYPFIEGRSEIVMLSDDFEEVTEWNLPDDTQWEVGSPAAGVGPASASSGANLLGTNLDGNLSYTPGSPSDVAIRQVPFDRLRTGVCGATLQFDTWYDMGQPCPRDCTNAGGHVMADDLSDGGTEGWEWIEPAEGYTGPSMCGGDSVILGGLEAVEGLSEALAEYRDESFYSNFGGDSGGEWRTVRMPLNGYQFSCSAWEINENAFDIGFNLRTSTGEPLNSGWYIDDLQVTALTVYGRIPFVAGPPDSIYSYTLAHSATALSESCEFPWFTETYVYDEWYNPVPGAMVNFTLATATCSVPTDLSGIKAPGSAVFVEAIEGDDFTIGAAGTASARTSSNGRIALTIDDPVNEGIVLQSAVGALTDTNLPCENFDDEVPMMGECCENAMAINLYTSYGLDPCDYRENDQMQLCGFEHTGDVVLSFTYPLELSSQYMRLRLNCKECGNSYSLELTETDGSTCPGEFPASTVPGTECQGLASRYYYLESGKKYLVTIQSSCDYDEFVYFSIGS